jgi:hypothetical protein
MGRHVDEFRKRQAGQESGAHFLTLIIAVVTLGFSVVTWTPWPLVSGMVVIIVVNGGVYIGGRSGLARASTFDDWEEEAEREREKKREERWGKRGS